MKINLKKMRVLLLTKVVSDPKKILKLIIIVAGVSLFAIVSFIGMTYASSTPKLCVICHIMKPEVATWEASSHSQVDCVTCHVDSGMTNALKHKAVAAKELYQYVTKSYELPIRMTEEIPDDRCLQCHATDRKVSPSYPGLYIPHERHNEKGVACVKCHRGVAHGNIASRGMTMGGDFGEWDKVAGTKVMDPEFTLPEMELCMDCHGRRGVTVACEACHSGNMMPDAHREKSFKLNHGQQAKKDINYCDTCHSYIKAPGVTSNQMPDEEDPVARYLASMQTGSDSDYTDYAKTNEYCVDCHKKRPVTHNDNWPFEHGKRAEQDEQKCLVCHSSRRDVKGTTQKAACSSCHPSIHKNRPWRVSHPIEIPPRYAVLEPRCFQCHVKDTCSGCHRVKETDSKTLPKSKITVTPVQ